MSIRIMSGVWATKCSSSTEKLVFIALADNANDQGYCFPSIATIAKKCDLTTRGVQIAIKRLMQKGFLMVNIRGGRQANEYQLPTPAPDAPLNTVHPTPERGSPQLRTEFTPPLNGIQTNRNITVNEPSVNHHVRDAFAKPQSLEQVKLQGAKIGLAEIECEKFFDHYESNGWKVGKNPMKKWTSALANWKRNSPQYSRQNKTYVHPLQRPVASAEQFRKDAESISDEFPLGR